MANNVVVMPVIQGVKTGCRRSDLNRLRLASWNIRTLILGKFIQLIKVLHRRRISIACV